MLGPCGMRWASGGCVAGRARGCAAECESRERGGRHLYPYISIRLHVSMSLQHISVPLYLRRARTRLVNEALHALHQPG